MKQQQKKETSPIYKNLKDKIYRKNKLPEKFLNIWFPTYNYINTTDRWNKNFILSFLSNHIIYYATPSNLTYAWSFGSLAGICLLIQIISGIFLSMYYIPHIDLAFASVEFIMRDVNHGWLIRYIHSNGASMFFLVLYCHLFRGLYYGSYFKPREFLWISGVVLLLLVMATAFLGYVLPWGQMSFWGATVITSMFTAIPKIGKYIVEWLWGGFTVNNPTLNRFFTLHFFIPFVIVGVTFLHLTLLHKVGSSAPISDSTGVDSVPFYPYFFVKDLFAFFCFLLLFGVLVFYYPNLLADPNNYIPADPIHTPRHIAPEWYFLPFYAILRSIPHKVGGILAMLFSLLILFILPFINTSLVRDTSFRPLFKFFYFAAIADFIILSWVGQSPARDAYIFVGQVATAYYFIFFLVLIPLTGVIETFLIHRKIKKENIRTPRHTFIFICQVLTNVNVQLLILVLLIIGSFLIELSVEYTCFVLASALIIFSWAEEVIMCKKGVQIDNPIRLVLLGCVFSVMIFAHIFF